MMYLRYPLSLCNVEDLLFERGIDICHETVRQSQARVGVIAACWRRVAVGLMGWTAPVSGA